MNFRESFSNHLSHLRKEKGITLAALGEYLSVSDEAVRLMEKGKRSPSFEVLCALADYFDVPTDYLTGRGIFKNWEEIMENKEHIFPILQSKYPVLKNINLSEADEKSLMQLLPTIIHEIKFLRKDDSETIEMTLNPIFYTKQPE